MDSYSAEVFAEARRQKILDEAEQRRLLSSAAADDPEPGPGRGRSWGARRPFAIARRLGHVTEGS